MSLRRHLIPLPLPLLVCALLLAGSAQAEMADRSKPMVVEADLPGTVDLQRQVVVFNGNVVISQGSMVLRAERVELRETPDGYRAASAIGSPGKPATWRQRRDGVDETVEGAADRIEFDGRADTLRLLGNGAVRRLRGSALADEITGAAIVWDNTAEVFKVEGGVASAANPTGRVRAVLSPRPDPASAPAASAAPAAPALAPSRALGEGR
ncbi:MAG: lipopolysaccharide transport periplasmic protein LptA [Rubrivivax sp.]|nr:lipopolysaccharide transport periplasmic protein LptA [Rubrivivax sp.]